MSRRTMTINDPFDASLQVGSGYLVITGDTARVRIKVDKQFIVREIALALWRLVAAWRTEVTNTERVLRGPQS